MVKAFAHIVAGNNIVIGFVIFIILIVVQVLVVTKGAGRVSEVAARFSLDSMNQKMFDIDNRLNSGAIDEQEAERLKTAIRKEIDFYSNMDGSSKFVSGNVKAGISGLSAKNNLRFWASNSWDKAEQSLFRVYDDGSLFATRAYTFMPASEINDSNIDNYITTSSIVYLDKKTNTKQSYTYSFFNFDLTGSKILINTKNTKITRINMPVNKEYYGATIEIYNPNNSELNFSTNVPDLEYCDINNYLDKMIIQGYIGSYNSFNQDYYNFPSGLVSLNRGSMFGRVAIVKGIVNSYRFTIRRKNYKPISEYTYLRFRMVRIALNGDMRDYLGRYYSVNEDGCVYLWICEEKQKEPKFINTSSSSSSTSVPKIVGGFKK